ncbi:MAG: hypothetical protein OWQ52_02190 [Metallosphaera prunae]|uniref:hypothetical protein n=1 Tax=Metallosphaera prunae TaxID=47304 RepID=UPI002275DD4A|nr:hypothetical protein [Metallosphaera prunae]MCY0861217.1 hypothetical protein [Metallosphaera prunae]
MTTTSHASYTEERSLVTRKELVFSTIFVVAGGFVGILTSPELFLVILPLSISVLLFKEWKLFRGMQELQRAGILRFEPRFKTNRKEANRSLVVVLLLIATPMVLSFFLPPLPWLAITMAIVMSWPASNLLEGITQLAIEKRTGKKLRKFYTWTSFRDDVVMKDYGWSLK